MDYIRKIEKYDPAIQEKIYSFLDQIDPSGVDDYLRTIAFSALHGQKETEKEFASYKARNEGASLTEGQNPHYAYSGGSNANGHEKYFVGQTMVGETLVLRLPGSEWFAADGQMVPEAQAFIALVQSKGIKQIVHSKNDSSKMLEITYAYHSAISRGENPALSKELEGTPSVLLDYAKQCHVLYREVEIKGFDSYAAKGINFDKAKTEAEKFKLAMAAQALMWDLVGACQYKDPKPEIVPILQSDFTASHYLYLAHEDRFIPVPDQEGSPAQIKAKMKSFFKDTAGHHPCTTESNEDHLAWHNTVHALSVGYGLYLKTKERRDGLNNVRLTKAGSSSCTDSRTPAHLILGRPGSDGFELYVLRAPGNSLVNNEGALTETALRYLAIARLEQVPVVHSHHSTCGAMNAATDHLTGKNQALPPAFQTLGEAHRSIYNEVLKAGSTEKEIVGHYQSRTGVKVNNFADCLGLQQLLNDVHAAQHYAKTEGASVVGVFHNTSEGQLYLYNKNKNKGNLLFVKVPSVFSPKPLMEPTRERSFSTYTLSQYIGTPAPV
ncbi:MAG: carbonic anhydrase [Bdellovibrionales bacterium]|jgi:carbonic anhydrase